ncbi:head GIN domain-containing protein [Flavobacterium sp.]|uniref:head GIN domain-containing protein n=1 Tax=Flavobacterium sp. TaxID=239 RepID=UPI002FDA3FF8
MKTWITCFVLFFCTLASAQWRQEKIKGNGKISSKEIKTNSYETLSIGGSFHVTLIEGAEGNIKLTGEENILEYVVVECTDSELKIHTEKGFQLQTSKGNKIEIQIPIQEIHKINLAGSGKIVSNFKLKSNELSVTLAGSGNIKLDLQTTNVEVKLAGSGTIELKGQTQKLVAGLAGSGTLKAQDLITETSTVSVSGSGKINTFCSEFIEAKVAGSGSIDYLGNPKKVDTKVAGSGKIRML